jgi:hypothetical protein
MSAIAVKNFTRIAQVDGRKKNESRRSNFKSPAPIRSLRKSGVANELSNRLFG